MEPDGCIIKTMKIKIIATGSTKWERFIHRWGVSFLIGEDLLFDTFGKPGVLLSNMRKFNINPAQIKHIFLSHDDWDHISGLWGLIQDRSDVTVYICPGFKQEIKDRIASFGVRVVEAEALTVIKENVFSSGQMQSTCSDRVIFEQVLVLKSSRNLSIITGCAHPGIINIIDTVERQFPQGRVYALAGGFHLKDYTHDVTMHIIGVLKDKGIRRIVPTHCTGKWATKMIRYEFGYRCLKAVEGSSIEL